MFKNKQITIKYEMTNIGSSKFVGVREGEVTLKTRPFYIEEAGCGFNFLENRITGDWGQKGIIPANIYFRQEENIVKIFTFGYSKGVSCGKGPFESIRDGLLYDYVDIWEKPINIDEVFVIRGDKGQWYAKLKIIGIDDRKDIPVGKRRM
jgi:hypothetical protein